VDCLCKNGYVFDGAVCVGMYPPMYYQLKKHVYVYHCTNVIIIIYIFYHDNNAF
jgi:hypothetical protein